MCFRIEMENNQTIFLSLKQFRENSIKIVGDKIIYYNEVDYVTSSNSQDGIYGTNSESFLSLPNYQ